MRRILDFSGFDRINEAQAKPSQVMADSFNNSPEGKGLQKLGARIKSQGIYRLSIEGIGTKQVVDMPEHPSNPFKRYRVYEEFHGDILAEDVKDNLEDVWEYMWERAVVKKMPAIPGKTKIQVVQDLKKQGIGAKDQLSIDDMTDLLTKDSIKGAVNWDDLKGDPRIKELERNGFKFSAEDKIGRTLLTVQYPNAEFSQYMQRVFPPGEFLKTTFDPDKFVLSTDRSIPTSQLKRGVSGDNVSVFKMEDPKRMVDKITEKIEQRWKELQFWVNFFSAFKYPGHSINFFKNWGSERFVFSKGFLINQLNKGKNQTTPYNFKDWLDGPDFKKFLKETYEDGQGNLMYAFIDNKRREVQVPDKKETAEDYWEKIREYVDDESEMFTTFYEGLPKEIRDRLFGEGFQKRMKVKKIII